MMHFDDRLGTVLRLRADGLAVKRIQFRQLLDLLGTTPVDARGESLEAAYVRLGELAEGIALADRVAMMSDRGLRLRSPRLIAHLAQDEPALAAQAIDRAELGEEEWLDLIPALTPAARVHLRRRHDLTPRIESLLARLGVNDRGLPPAQRQAEASNPTVIPPLGDAGEPGAIGTIVKRIEAFRRSRQVIEGEAGLDSPRLPLGEDHVLKVPAEARAFNFATAGDGRIAWADPGVAPMVMGILLGGDQASGPEQLNEAVARRQHLRGLTVRLAGAPAIAGEWFVDAAPWFDPLNGNYLGHRGRFRRVPAPADQALANAPVRDSEADRIRQALHELRTPVNAIQIGAEIIQQQLYGPTPHEYRALAASIVGDAARMLSAFEELERLAKLDSGAMDLESGATDVAALIEATVAQLDAHTCKRASGFELEVEQAPLMIGLARIEIERIVWRLLATLAGVSAPGEVLKVRLRMRRGMVRLDVELPAVLASRDDKELFSAAAGSIPQVIAAGVFGVGFALRLARAEAESAGGQLDRKKDRLRLTLPGLTGENDNHTQTGGRTSEDG
jgi:hypothetical protein